MQYFGHEEERGWLFGSSILEFKGKKQFDEHVKEIFANAKKNEKSKLEKSYKVSPRRLQAWNIAIKEAEEALPLSRNERKQKYTYIYMSEDKKGNSEVVKEEKTADSKEVRKGKDKTEDSKDVRKGKRKAETVDETSTAPTKRRKVDTSESGDHFVSPKFGSGDGSFDVFCQKLGDSVLEEHPDFDDEALMGYLKQQWCMMSKKQKARYRSKFTEQQGR